ncbi:DUF6479 family protein [Streptomyces enissocaesilis]|uniref:Secreted protein n=1 Tax=Streptomyces enissocaesilis TaxID=332589 RepID=A0ABP6JT90_9ACTN
MSALQSRTTGEIAGFADPVAASDLVIGIAPFIAGLAVVAALTAAVWWGIRIRSREPAPPTPEEQPHRPPDAELPEDMEYREPDEVTPAEGRRLLPHELRNSGNSSGRHSDKDPHERRQWSENSGGSFGSGGPGG